MKPAESLVRQITESIPGALTGASRKIVDGRKSFLQEGWVIANHILVSFHVAFISSVLAIPDTAATREAVLHFIFLSPETIISAIFTYAVFHTAIALHEMGHFLEAARLRALSDSIQESVEARLAGSFQSRLLYLIQLFLLIPFGRATGVKREGLNYYPDAPYNLAVAAAGPRASLSVARVALPVALVLLSIGLTQDITFVLNLGRLLLGLGVVTGLDFLLADPGKYREFRRREALASEAAASLPEASKWAAMAPAVKQRIVERSMQDATHPRLGTIRAPWQFRNCGMGGVHTEKEYPESNISMQEAMFLILGAVDSQEAQEMTVRLQNRLKEILEKAEGCRVMGIGLEGGLAPYIDRGEYELPELRLWVMMKQTIEQCGYQPGVDVAIALDPALSELEIAYREEFDVPDSIGMYLFWRDHAKKVMDRDAVLAIYEQAIFEYDIPILSIEDGFSEDDLEGWRKLLDRLGDLVLVVGDDLVTTNDRTIEMAAAKGLINSVLVKANQIGSLYETMLAVLVTLGKGLNLIVSHRSKSPNDDMEAHIALATNALGLKAGGGANTERLVKYQAVTTQMERVMDSGVGEPDLPEFATVERLRAREEPTNAGIPTVGADVLLALPGGRPDSRVRMTFHGSTPLGTSSGTGEAVHLVDAVFERAEFLEAVEGYPQLMKEVEPGVFAFEDKVTRAQVESTGDKSLLALFKRTGRYNGKGCLNAVDHVHEFAAPFFEEKNVAQWSLFDIDRALLKLELATATRRGKLAGDGDRETEIHLMQRKQNLGMNAILSTSLALARGVAHVRGQELYEFLREEMLVIIEHLAGAHGIAIEGSRFDDYLAALIKVNTKLEAEDIPLYQALREMTGIYHQPVEPTTVHAPYVSSVPVIADEEESFSAQEHEQIAVLNRTLVRAYLCDGDDVADDNMTNTLRRYLETMTFLGRRYRMFEIANHRIFLVAGDKVNETLIVPYNAHGRLSIYALRRDSEQLVKQVRLPHGTLVTDALVADLAGIQGDVIDLEREIYHIHVDDMPTISVARLRDLARLLRRLNDCGSRHEAVYLLRFLVARLCSSSYRGMPGAKNLKPEITRVRVELAEFMNGPFASRLRLPTSILVRSISGLVSQPKLIDEVWQDTIDLSEVHVAGSAITNEIRRSTHHAMGKHTLMLARAYLQWLETGTADFPDPEREIPGPADDAARLQGDVPVLVKRIVSNLEQLLGSSQIARRIEEWRGTYANELLRCESTNTLEEELESLVSKGIQALNPWVYQHRLRGLISKLRDGAWTAKAREPFEVTLLRLQETLPEGDDFPAGQVEADARAAVSAFCDQLRHDHQDALFSALDELLGLYKSDEQFEAFERSCSLRHELESLVGTGVFSTQRYLLHQLDCILEELGFFALRHVASGYAEHGMQLNECLRIVHLCAGNLERDGLFSRELWDLSTMLVNKARRPSELLDVLEQIQRNYHRLIHRVSNAYEVMAEHLGYGKDEMRAVLANFQRTMHDLNSLVHFSDLARSYISEDGRDISAMHAGGAGEEPWDFVHLSHGKDIKRRVEDKSAVSLQGRYGGKGSGLIYIAYLGIPTRDGFIIPTVLPRMDLQNTERERFDEEILRHTRLLESDIEANEGTALRLGDPEAPLLLAVRGGSVFSMPGMLATMVFIGMTDAIADALAREDEWYAWDAYRRFLVSFSAAVWNLDLEELDLVEKTKRRHGVALKTDLPGFAMREVVESSKQAIRDAGHADELEPLLNDAELQLKTALRAVHSSWDGDRARQYRSIKHLSEGWHTGAIVQHMASGNRTNRQELKPGIDEMSISLTGVIPNTRMQATGFREFTGDVKFSACGDDLVGGITAAKSFEPVQRLHSLAPMLERKLNHISARLRRFLGSDAEIEFTVDRGVLSVLQARSAQMDSRFDPRTFKDPGTPAGRGIGISGGAFRGLVAFNATDVERLVPELERQSDVADGVLLLLENPVPDEIPLILSVDGLLAARGGSTSHAAVCVHGLEDKPYSAVLGVPELRVSSDKATLSGVEGQPPFTVHAGDILSIHGQTGEVFTGSREILSIKQDITPAAA
jgi:enolase